MTDPGATVELGRQVLRLEGAAVEAVADRLDERFAHAVRLLARAAGRVIVTGVGKSGLVARKIAATLTSTGTPASYLHPIDSLHGDLGIVGPHDVALVLSKSGDSQDLFGLVGSLQRLGVPIIALTGALDSPLARVATVVLDGSVAEEACPYDLAPTASTTVAMALGDALAVALLERKGFRPEDFAALHPGGSLGRRLLLRVRDVMLPPGRILPPEATMREAMAEGRLTGVLTTGDLTRLAERDPDFLGRPVVQVMTRSPKTTGPDDLAAAAVGTMERNGVIVLPVISDGGKIEGVVHLHDLMRAGAV